MPQVLRSIWLATAACAVPMVLGTQARAAEAEDAATAVTEVIVTAQKRSESVQRVPAAITALNSEMLDERGITQAADLKFVVPSMQTGTLSGGTNIGIRGISNNLAASSAAPAVAVHVDGVYQPIASMGDLGQVDLQRVEVLRGPQGTLYGRNANAGAINFITNAPTDTFEGYVQAGYATYNETRLQSVINVPFSDRVRARAVIDWNDRGKGFVKNILPGGKDVDKATTLSARLRVAAEITDNLRFDLTVADIHSEGPTQYYTLHNKPTPLALATNTYLVNAIVPTDPWRTATNDPVSGSRDYFFSAGTFTWDLGDVQLKSVTGWQRLGDQYDADDDGTNLSAFVARRVFRSKTFTQELNASGSFGPLNAVVGAFYMHDLYDYDLHYVFPLGFGALPRNTELQFNQFPLKTEALAAFADATWNLTDRFRLIGGLRLSRDKLTATQYNFVKVGGTTVSPTCPLQTNDIVFHSTTPRAGVQYDVAAQSNVYATFSKGFKDGAFNRNSCNQPYLPEKVTAYEAGVKNRFLDGALTLNASAFYYDYTNLQLVQTVGITTKVTNAAAARVKGLEFEATWRPDSHWTVNANLALLRAKYTAFSNVDGIAPQLGLQDVSGNYLNNAPKETANVGVAYRTDDLSFGRLTFRADVSQRTRYYFREFNNPLDSQPGVTITNLAIIWESLDSKYRVRLYGNNIFKEAYIAAMGASDAFGSRFIQWGSPRQLGAELRASF